MFDRISNLFSINPDYEARLESNNFIKSATIERGSDGEKSHTLRIKFKQPVRDGNEIAQLNVRNENGTIVGELPLRIGETGLPMPIEPIHTSLDLVAINNDGQVDSTDHVTIREL